MRTRDSALKGGDNGAAIVPGRADQSRLYRRIAGLEEPSMPLSGELTAQQIAIIKTWIDQGAHWDMTPSQTQSPGQIQTPSAEIPAAARNYWAFKLPVQAAVPGAGNFRNPIDR